MKYLLLLFCGVWVVSALPVENKPVCVVGDWGNWQEATQMNPAKLSSPHVQATKERDAGVDAWERMMAEKEYEFSLPVEEIASATNLNAITKCDNGQAENYQCMNVDLLTRMDFNQLGCKKKLSNSPSTNPRGNDLWGWTDPVNGDEYVIMGLNHGSAFVRITDPYNPEALGFLYSETETRNWRDMKVVGNFVYIGAECYDHGIQIFDLTRLRGAKNFVPKLEADAVYRGVGQSHNIVANEETGYIYVVGANRDNEDPKYNGCHAGLHVLDVSNPKDPQFVGCYEEDGYVHDAQCVIYKGPDARFVQREICFTFNEDTFNIIDVTDKSNMFEISKQTYAGERYTHQGWLTEDHSTLLMDDESDENGEIEQNTKTYIWDIRDLVHPVLRNVHKSNLLSVDHNQYINGRFTYQANYESGLRILAINQMDFTLKEVGYFDVYPSRTTARFNGAWSTYPYFKSGVVPVSSINHGLFLVRPDYRALEMAATTTSASSTQSVLTRYREILSKDQGSYCPATQENKVV